MDEARAACVEFFEHLGDVDLAAAVGMLSVMIIVGHKWILGLEFPVGPAFTVIIA